MAHQRTALDWAEPLRAAILALDMGLGKTPIAVRYVRDQALGGALVVTPAGLRINWQREFDTFWPAHPPIQVVTGTRDRIGAAPIVIVNYDLLPYPAIFEQLKARRWPALICDESQMANNLDSLRGAAILGRRGLAHSAERVLALSGTPAPNHVGELHAWLRIVAPDLLKAKGRWPDVTHHQDFLKQYLRYRPTRHGIQVLGSNNAQEFRERFSPVILRMKKADVLHGLPPLRFAHVTLESDSLGDVLAYEKHPDFDGLRLVLENLDLDAPNAYDRLKSALERIELATLRRLVAVHKIAPVADLVRQELGAGLEKVVIFGHHRELLDGLAERLQDFKTVVVHGGVSPTARQRAVDQFQSDPKCRVFVGQLDAAGVGYTLTAASDVLLAESSWVPSKNKQAVDRVYRIGQSRPCLARFVSLAGSVDEIVMRVQARKLDALESLLL
ncbi:DEAD/DEAH box helicase [Pseudomonas sp. PDM21]|uniref:DEAD/DEAH box helicase n=1 Tax=Pseudomonas sp. PDM21 TaxID=2769257 RepID=UPI001782F9DA|nr:DEAD/DEAH box helicase [Pseudomonas sp. PDM21]MBD9674935.1 DEAD/DEAH box helicase [Pseudomonas sp. PDM21]